MISKAVRKVMEDYAWGNFDKEKLPKNRKDLSMTDNFYFTGWYLNNFPKSEVLLTEGEPK